MSLELPFGIRILNKSANLDDRYGPHSTLAEAYEAVKDTEEIGLTVMVSGAEYWFKDNINNLVPKLSVSSNGLSLQGNWDANFDTISANATEGQFWIVSVSSSITLGGIDDWVTGDWAIKTANGWAKNDNTDRVSSVNGKSGVVTLGPGDISGLADAIQVEVNNLVTTDFVDGLNVNARKLNGMTESDFAKTAGNAANNFAVSDATQPTHAVNKNQMDVLFESMKNVIRVAPVYRSPLCYLDNNLNRVVEHGSSLSNLDVNANYNQREGGAATFYEWFKNSLPWVGSANSNLSSDFNNITSPITLTVKAIYEQGPILSDNIGEEYPTGRILAGSVLSSVKTITPKLKAFFGSVASIPTTSAEIRSLPNSVWFDTNNFDFVVGSAHNIFVIAVPTSRMIVSVIDPNSKADWILEYKGSTYGKNVINVNNASFSNPVSTEYDIYIATPSKKYNSVTATHSITLTNKPATIGDEFEQLM